MLTSYVGVADPRGNVIPVRNPDAGAERSHRPSHTHVYLIDEAYTCTEVAVRSPSLQPSPEQRHALHITSMYSSEEWTVYRFAERLPSDQAAVAAEHLCAQLDGSDYRPKIPVPLTQGECIPSSDAPIPPTFPVCVDTLLANEIPRNYVQAMPMFDVTVQLPQLREACPLLHRCVTSPGLVTSSDALAYIYYAFSSKLSGLPLNMLTRAVLRTTLPRLTYVPTCRMVRELAPGHCDECQRYRPSGTPIDTLAAIYVAERIIHRLSPVAMCDLDLHGVANILDPICTVDGIAFQSVVQAVAKNMGGTARVVKALQERLVAYRSNAGNHPVRRLVEAYRLRQYLTRMEESSTELAEIILGHFADDGATFTTRHDGSYMAHAGKTLRLSRCREFDTWMYPLVGAQTTRTAAELSTALEVVAASKAAATNSVGFGLHKENASWYIYQSEEQPAADGWRDAYTMEPVNLDAVYTGPQCFNWSGGMTSVASCGGLMRTIAEDMGFSQEDFAFILAYMASSLYLGHIPNEWIKPLYVQVRPGQAERASVVAGLLSLLYYGHDASQDLEPWLCCSRDDMPLAISYYAYPNRIRQRRIRGQMEIFVTPSEPEPNGFSVLWNDASIQVTPWWKEGLMNRLQAVVRPPLLASFLAVYRDIGFDAVLDEVRKSETPHLHLLRRYAFRMSDDYHVTRENVYERLPGMVKTFWRAKGYLPDAVKCDGGGNAEEVIFRLPVVLAHSSFQTMAMDLGTSVAPNVTPRVVALAYNKLDSHRKDRPNSTVSLCKGTYQGARMYYIHIKRFER